MYLGIFLISIPLIVWLIATFRRRALRGRVLSIAVLMPFLGLLIWSGAYLGYPVTKTFTPIEQDSFHETRNASNDFERTLLSRTEALPCPPPLPNVAGPVTCLDQTLLEERREGGKIDANGRKTVFTDTYIIGVEQKPFFEGAPPGALWFNDPTGKQRTREQCLADAGSAYSVVSQELRTVTTRFLSATRRDQRVTTTYYRWALFSGQGDLACQRVMAISDMGLTYD